MYACMHVCIYVCMYACMYTTKKKAEEKTFQEVLRKNQTWKKCINLSPKKLVGTPSSLQPFKISNTIQQKVPQCVQIYFVMHGNETAGKLNKDLIDSCHMYNVQYKNIDC